MSFSAEASLTDSLENSAQLSNLTVIKIHTFSQHTSDSEFTKEAVVVRSHLTMMITSLIKKRAHNLNMLTIICSDFLIKLLSSFLNNLMMISETNFLSLIEKHLFSAINSSQNQRSKVQLSFIIIIKQKMLKSQIQTLLQIIFDINVRWISDDQRIMIIIMLESQQNILIILISSNEKNLLIMISVLLSQNQMTVIIILFIALHDDLQTWCWSVKMHMLIWSCDTVFIISLILIISKLVMLREFQMYLQKLIWKKYLACLIFNKYHVTVINNEWYKIMRKMH